MGTTEIATGRVVLHTYPVIHQPLGETNDPIYLFVRDRPAGAAGGINAALAISKSTNGGVNWSANTLLCHMTSTMCYWRIESNGVDRLDFVVADGTTLADAASAYHFYYEGNSYYRSDGR